MNFLKSWTLPQRLYFTFFILIGASIVIQAFSIVKSNELSKLMDKFYKHPYTVSTESKELEIRISSVEREVKSILSKESPSKYDIFESKTIVYVQKIQIESIISVLDDRFLGDKKTISIIKSKMNNWFSQINNFYSLISLGNKEKAKNLYENKLSNVLIVVSLKLLKLQIFAKKKAKAFNKNSIGLTEDNFIKGLIYSSLFIVLSCFLAYFFTRDLKRKLSSVAEKLLSSSGSLDSNTTMIKEISTKLIDSSTTQASSLQETLCAVEEISSMVQRNAESANTSTKISEKSSISAKNGKQTVEEMIISISDISKSNENIMAEMKRNTEEIEKIVNVISEIGDKTKVINDIVFQTKLLSFNASVEAARAGEHGKGFAVVAEEVGNLASMSGKAAGEISDMLEASVKNVNEIASNTKLKIETLVEEGKNKVDQGESKAQECGKSLGHILDNVHNVNDMIKEIAMASSEQSTGVDEINKSIHKLDSMTNQNTMTAKDTADTASKIESESESLQNIVSELINLIGKNSSNLKSNISDMGSIEVENAQDSSIKKAS